MTDIPRAQLPTDADSDVLQRLQTAVGDTYRIRRRIGEGGMATVFLAEDVKHGRNVAIKVLQETLAHTIGIRRFLQEIEVVARLQHPHLLTLIDSGSVGELPYYVMPYLEALSLRELITKEQRLSVADAVRIAREVADGLQFAHEHGVVHRDIKPSNVLLSGGHAVVADFGIATALEKAAVGRLTETGISLGSPTYMSPEQAAGERDLDERSDIYSLGCVLYELLCGEPPIDGSSMQAVVRRKLTGDIASVASRRPDVPRGVADAIARAMATERVDRFPTMKAFSDALGAAVTPPTARMSPRAMAGVAVAGAVAVVLLGFVIRQERRNAWAARQIPEIGRLSARGEFVAAFELGERALTILPRDSALRRLRDKYANILSIVTDPPGARVYRRRLDRPTEPWEMIGTTPLDSVAMPALGIDVTYALRIQRPGFQTREVLPHLFAPWARYRGVMPIDTFRLDAIATADTNMVRVPGWRARHPARAGDSITLADYFIGKREVTNREYKRFVDAGGYGKAEYWREPFVRDGRPLAFDEAIAAFQDRTGLAGPATWSGGTYLDGQADHPVGGVSWYEAQAYARFAGARLPTSTHWFRAALWHHREASWLYMPTSNLSGTAPRRAGTGASNAFGMFDVAGNVREWVANPLEAGRVTRGAAWDDADFHVLHLIPKPELDRSPGNGVRLMKASDHDTTIAHLSGRLTRSTPRDYGALKLASDAEFRIMRRLYDYDPAPLDPRRESQGISERFRWEKVSFTSPVSGERMAAYVILPRAGSPPYQAVVLWSGSNALSDRALDVDRSLHTDFLGYIALTGRALVIPLLKGTFERDDSTFSIAVHPTRGTTTERDLTILWHKELRRTVDYLQSRPDIRRDGIGYYGFSWGGRESPIALAVEPRFRAAVLNVGGLGLEGSPLPEVDHVQYLPRVRTPVLMLNGRHDVVFPYETAQLPFFRLLGTPPADKRHVVFQAGHLLPQSDQVRETLAWFDKYMGRP